MYASKNRSLNVNKNAEGLKRSLLIHYTMFVLQKAFPAQCEKIMAND